MMHAFVKIHQHGVEQIQQMENNRQGKIITDPRCLLQLLLLLLMGSLQNPLNDIYL